MITAKLLSLRFWLQMAHGWKNSLNLVLELNWVIPEKIHISPTDGTLEILAGGGAEGSGKPGGRGGV